MPFLRLLPLPVFRLKWRLLFARSLQPDVDVFYWAVVTHAKTTPLRPYALRRLLDSMLESGLQPGDLGVIEDDEGDNGEEDRAPRTGGEVYGMVLHWLTKANRGQSHVLTEALDAISSHGVRPDRTMCNEAIALHAHARPARPAEAEELIERFMTPKGSTEDDGCVGLCVPDAETFELLAQAYTRASADQQKRHGPGVGERVLGRMIAAGLQPKTANLNAAIAGYALARPPQIDEVRGAYAIGCDI